MRNNFSTELTQSEIDRGIGIRKARRSPALARDKSDAESINPTRAYIQYLNKKLDEIELKRKLSGPVKILMKNGKAIRDLK